MANQTRKCLSRATADGHPCQQDVDVRLSHCESGHLCTTSPTPLAVSAAISPLQAGPASLDVDELLSGGAAPDRERFDGAAPTRRTRRREVASDSSKIAACEFKPDELLAGLVMGAGNPHVHVIYENDESEDLFSFYADELHFVTSEFIGLTRRQALDLFRDRDIAYLRS